MSWPGTVARATAICVTPGSSRAFWISSPTSRPLPCSSAWRPKPCLSTENHWLFFTECLLFLCPAGHSAVNVSVDTHVHRLALDLHFGFFVPMRRSDNERFAAGAPGRRRVHRHPDDQVGTFDGCRQLLRC